MLRCGVLAAFHRAYSSILGGVQEVPFQAMEEGGLVAYFLLQAGQPVLHLPHRVILGLQLLLQRLQIRRQPAVARLP